MACDITSGRKVPCKNNLGGIKEIIFINEVRNPFTVVNSQATAINPLITEAFRYSVKGEGDSFAQNMVPDRNSGTTVNTITLTAVLQKMTKEDHHQLNLLAVGFPVAVVVDRNDVYHAVGISEGMDFTIAATTGAAHTDLQGYTITGTSMEGELAPILSEATVEALLDLIVEDTPSV